MPDQETTTSLVEALAAEYVERCRRGDRPTIAEYEARHPHVAAEIRALFPTIAALEKMRTRHEVRPDGRASLGPKRPARLGDFRIIAELGRGGMGVVYEAIQESLDRRVAVKVLARHALGDDSHRRRFLREARTAGRLHHTNIVPILGVGQHEGLDYYVMQCIDGVGLDVAIDRLRQADNPSPETLRAPGGPRAGKSPATQAALAPTVVVNVDDTDPRRPAIAVDQPSGASPSRSGWSPTTAYWRDVAHVGFQAARAIEYAHRHDTLHRDIKPANLVLDGEGNVWITDFGLAKATDDDRLSRTGDILGTCLYAAPEQFHGAADCRSDVFSLGATLYELATLRPPFSRTDRWRGADVDRGATPTTTGVSTIPRDLETILLKAIADDPRDRYQSAGDLADDLERFLDDEPIQARRPGIAERWVRWSRRNRREAWLTAAAAVLLLLVAVVATAGFAATRMALRSQSQQRVRAENSLALSLAALDKVFGRLVPGPWGESGRADYAAGPQPVVSPDTAALLEELLPLYDRIAEQQGSEAATSAETARAVRRMGDIHLHLGDLSKAEADYRRAIDQFTALSAAVPAPRWTLELARLRNQCGMIFARQGKIPEAHLEHRAAIASLGEAGDADDGIDRRLERARSHYLLGRRPVRPLPLALDRSPSHRPPPDGPGGRPGGPPRGPGGGRRPPPPRPDDGPEHDHRRHGEPPPPHDNDRCPPPDEDRPPKFRPPDGGPRDAGRPGEEWRPPPLDDFADEPSLGQAAPQPDRAELQSAVDLLEPLLKSAGDRAEPRYLLALCYRELATPAPLPDYDRAVALLLELLAADPRRPDYRYELAATYSAFDIHYLSRDEMPAADERLKLAVEQSQQLVDEHPYATDYSQLHIHILHKRGTLLYRMLYDPRPDLDRGSVAGRAAAALEEAIRREAAFVERFPEDRLYRLWLAQFRGSLADVRLAQHEPEQAQAYLEAAVADLQTLIDTAPDAEQGQSIRSLARRLYQTLAESFRAQQLHDLAKEAQQQADAFDDADQ